MDWLRYSPADFLLFAPRTYWRPFALENAALQPLTPLLPLIGLLVVAAAFRPGPWTGRPIWAAIAAGWLWSGLMFLGQRYASINWAAGSAAPVFAAQAALLLWFGVIRRTLGPLKPTGLRGPAGVALGLSAAALYPLLAPLDGRPLAQAELVGVAPDPTALLTLAMLALAPRGKTPALLSAIPAVWCAASVVTLLTMGAWQGWVVLAAGLFGLGPRLMPGGADRAGAVKGRPPA
jgi:hypothetical protein